MENKSNHMSRVIGVFAGFAIALGIAAVPAAAEQGTFNLSVPAHWGTAVLQPGKHKLNIPVPMGQTLIYLTGHSGTQMTVPLTQDARASSGRSYLHLAKVNGVYYVDEFQSGATGRTFFFAKPKSHERNPAPEEAEAKIIDVKGD